MPSFYLCSSFYQEISEEKIDKIIKTILLYLMLDKNHKSIPLSSHGVSNSLSTQKKIALLIAGIVLGSSGHTWYKMNECVPQDESDLSVFIEALYPQKICTDLDNKERPFYGKIYSWHELNDLRSHDIADENENTVYYKTQYSHVYVIYDKKSKALSLGISLQGTSMDKEILVLQTHNFPSGTK